MAWIRALKSVGASGTFIAAGASAEVSDYDADVLIRMRKAVAVEPPKSQPRTRNPKPKR